jgi:hypothetical protein
MVPSRWPWTSTAVCISCRKKRSTLSASSLCSAARLTKQGLEGDAAKAFHFLADGTLASAVLHEVGTVFGMPVPTIAKLGERLNDPSKRASSAECRPLTGCHAVTRRQRDGDAISNMAVTRPPPTRAKERQLHSPSGAAELDPLGSPLKRNGDRPPLWLKRVDPSVQLRKFPLRAATDSRLDLGVSHKPSSRH